ncbi:MAG: aminoglycoside phosphotransferase [Alphaproteobacteria bacterium]|nr:aminoglycoside phosphotransferase [Alphaproteobacteria bacterium]
MANELDPDKIAQILRQSGHVPGLRGDMLSVLSTKGISHDHWRVGDSGLVLRIPRMNQWGLNAADALIYQAAAFDRAAASGHVPKCRAVIDPSDAFPRGALLVDGVEGRPPALPDDLPAIAEALAAIHALPIPAADELEPLQVHRNPVGAALLVIEEQAIFLPRAGLADAAEASIVEDLEWAREFAGRGEPDFPQSLVCTDAHPGNFLIDAQGKAWFVDLEKALYGAVPIDLAHVTLLTSTGWDPDCTGDLTSLEVKRFYQQYLNLVGRQRADELRPWLLPMRRLTWLRTITWFVRWKVQWSSADHTAMRNTRMAGHINGHIAQCFEPNVVAATRRDWLAPNSLTN